MKPKKRLLAADGLWLWLFFLVYSAALLVRAALDPDGFLSSDSAHYLQLAQSILNGDGLSTANYVDGMSTYFATWPVGYPVLIALTAFISGLGVFWAAKVVNIICLGLCFLLLQRLFRGRSAVLALVFSISTISSLFVRTWSEVPFLFGLLWLVFGLTRFIQTEKRGYIAHLFFASLWLFFMRYIGLIGAGIVGLVGFYYLVRRRWKPMLLCWVSGSAVLAIGGFYLLVNWAKTGLFTGMERIPRRDTAAEFVTMLRDGVLSELDLFSVEMNGSLLASVVLVVLALVLFVRPRYILRLFRLPREQWLVPGLCLFVGAVYFTGIVAMRWSAFFDPFNFRLLGPATFMLALALVSWIAGVDKRAWPSWRRALTLVFGVVFLVTVAYPVYSAAESDEATYRETAASVSETYQAIPEGSIIAFENIHARYLRPDIQFIKVHFRPYFAEPESLTEFRERVTPNDAAGVYFQHESLQGYDYDASFEIMMQDNDKTFIPMRQ
ncbi:hypothetical protein GCM10028778_17840 [Barrientosiimonas marina]|uniref:Glycosyltransferase RgtA/B/C/D-like domain-containing protein n=1 Tax=Lentibacillus kimchii TaxID=1542911 RepID=A0ABW2UXA4_9BACI